MLQALRTAAALTAIAVLSSYLSPAAAQRFGLPAPETRGEWVMLGEHTVGFDVERDVIPIGRQEGRFTRLRLEAVRGDIYVVSLRVIFASGEVDEIPVRHEIQQGGRTGILTLSGGRPRQVEQAELVYRARAGFRGRAVVRLMGERVEFRPEPQPQPPVVDRFEELDIQRVDLRNDRFVMPVGRGEGRVSAIKLRALDHPVFVRRLEIHYGNGRMQEVRVGQVIEPGRDTQVVDLEGDLRFIKEVVVITRPQTVRREARLQLFGDTGREATPPAPPPRPVPPVAEPIDPSVQERLRPPPETDQNGVPRGLVLFGSQRVGFSTDRDVIRVGRQVGLFDKIVMRVLDNDVFLREFTIVYDNGERDRVPVGQEIRANTLTPSILLRGDRFIDRIEIIHQARPGRRGEATIEVYGEYAERWLGEQGRGRDYNEGWLLLGAQRAQLINNDTDTFEVGRRFGPIRALRITAKRHAVRILGVRVVYAGGRTEELGVNVELRDGQTSAPIDLRGRERFVEQVLVTARTRLNLKGEAVVELWGQQ